MGLRRQLVLTASSHVREAAPARGEPPRRGPMAAVPRTAVVRSQHVRGPQRLLGGSQREYERRRPPAASAAKLPLRHKGRPPAARSEMDAVARGADRLIALLRHLDVGKALACGLASTWCLSNESPYPGPQASQGSEAELAGTEAVGGDGSLDPARSLGCFHLPRCLSALLELFELGLQCLIAAWRIAPDVAMPKSKSCAARSAAKRGSRRFSS
jgi:hypothetical protein